MRLLGFRCPGPHRWHDIYMGSHWTWAIRPFDISCDLPIATMVFFQFSQLPNIDSLQSNRFTSSPWAWDICIKCLSFLLRFANQKESEPLRKKRWWNRQQGHFGGCWIADPTPAWYFSCCFYLDFYNLIFCLSCEALLSTTSPQLHFYFPFCKCSPIKQKLSVYTKLLRHTYQRKEKNAKDNKKKKENS